MLNSQRLIAASAIALATALATTASAPLAAQDAVEEDEGPGSGVLMLRAKDGGDAVPAVQLGTDMDVTVSGQVARIRVTQAFRNTSNRWVEASYLYPLPQDGAVDTLKMVVGQRVIIGKIKRREEAKKIYEKAMKEGRKASLVEQQRPNMFTNRVANVGPGETVLVQIEYQAPVRQVGGTFLLRLPLVVGPRYVPPHTLVSSAAARDAATITASPIARPVPGRMLNPVSIAVLLAPGFAPARIASPYHRIAVDGQGATRNIRLADGQVPADRDFELSWRAASNEPLVGAFKQQVGRQTYVMATVVPPVTAALPVPPREMVFVIDNSGSMGGSSMEEAKASLEHALRTLRPQDHFNVIRFDDSMTQLFERSVQATPEQVDVAIHFARSLEASGGTEMLPALKAALADAATVGDASTVRQIIFLTDGDISNEDEMAAAIAADQGRSHLFPVGIGSAPNNYLMARMANMGRGTYTNIGSAAEVSPKMTALLDALQRPAVQDVKIVASGRIDLTPKMLPDIYAGQSLVVLGRTDRLQGTMTVRGRIGARLWTSTVDLSRATDSPAVAKLWARKRIDEIETERTLGRIEGEAADRAIGDIGLEHSLVTSQTSLVAEDRRSSRPSNQPLTREELPINLPAGWDFDILMGGDAAKAAMKNAAEHAGASIAETADVVELPQTATNFMSALVNGLLLLLVGAIGLLWQRRRGVTE
jgi:Ca-activated chloride channel family protein